MVIRPDGFRLFRTSGLIVDVTNDDKTGNSYYVAEWMTSGHSFTRLIRDIAEYSDWRDFVKEAMTEYVKYLTAAIDKLYED